MWNLGTFLKHTAFLINLASFLPINPNLVLPQNHAIVQETRKELKDLSFIEGLLKNEKGIRPYRIHFNSHVSRAKKREDEDEHMKWLVEDEDTKDERVKEEEHG